MPARPAFHLTPKSLLGIAMLALGMGGIVVQFWSVASRIGSLVATPAADSLGTFAELGLASLRVLQHIAFDHSMLLSLAHSFLLSFTAFGISLAGLALLRNRGKQRRAS